jgi:phosphohistidine phosphatase SixA
MEPPGITRHRRPFLAPLWVTLLAALAVAGIAWAFYRDASTTVVILVHPAEKTPGTIDDPPLSPEGEERAQRLAQMFAGPAVGTIDAIYASDDRRAQQTAAPLAERLHRVPALLNHAEARAGAARALHEHGGGTVLMIVSGPALLQVLSELAGGAPAGAPDDPNLAYIISVPSVGHAHVVRLRM